MRLALILIMALALGGCAGAPVASSGDDVLRDSLVAPASQPISAAEVFALSDEMKRYVATEIGQGLSEKGRAKALYEALYSRNLLKIDYDATMTRNAAQTFAARSGNCLSLAIMTAALARELGLGVRYQAVAAEELWSRAGGIYFSSTHVNVALGRRHTDPKHQFEERNLLTIDFQPVGELQSQRTWPIAEATVVAMYMNNRAAEVLAQGQASEAYWWAREAIRQDPGYVAALNTLGVVYRRLGHLEAAGRALLRVLEREPENTHAMANLRLVYGDQGRVADAEALSRRLARLQPNPPFQSFERGIAAMKRGEFALARELFAREAERDPYYHEFQFWLAAAYASLGDLPRAREHLKTAIAHSPSRSEQDVYAAKLARLSPKN